MTKISWVSEWAEDNASVLEAAALSVAEKNREAFIACLPKYAYGWRYIDESSFGKNVDPENVRLAVSWVARGYCGGNCWGDEAQSFTNSDYPEDGILTEIVAYVFDNIPQCRITVGKAMTIGRRVKELTKYAEWTDCGYYGNYDCIEATYVDAGELYDYIVSVAYGGDE